MEKDKNKGAHTSTNVLVHICVFCVTGVLMDYEGARVGRTLGLTSKYTPKHPGVATLRYPGTSCCVGPLCSRDRRGAEGVKARDRTTCFRCRGIIYCGSFMLQQQL